MQKSQRKKSFLTHFLSHLPGLLPFSTPLEHTKNFWVGLWGSFAGLGGTFKFGGSKGCINPWELSEIHQNSWIFIFPMILELNPAVDITYNFKVKKFQCQGWTFWYFSYKIESKYLNGKLVITITMPWFIQTPVMGEARIFSRGRFKISLKNCKNSLFQHMKFWVDFRKFSKNFLRKLWKMHYFSKYLTTHALISFRI